MTMEARAPAELRGVHSRPVYKRFFAGTGTSPRPLRLKVIFAGFCHLFKGADDKSPTLHYGHRGII